MPFLVSCWQMYWEVERLMPVRAPRAEAGALPSGRRAR